MVNVEPTPSKSNNQQEGEEGGSDFECNICFEIAQDPIVTLCGHLFCWPCLYLWLHHHSHSRECPVCKALVEDDKLVPLYGRGKNQTDPRLKRYPGLRIPDRPAGHQRPETAAPPDQRGAATGRFLDYGVGLMGGFMPMAMANTRFGSFSVGFGGLLPSLFNFQFHGFHDAAMYGGNTPGFPYGNGFRGVSSDGQEGNDQRMDRGGNQSDAVLKNLLLFVGFCVLMFICSCCY
ncbi:unnamed protein product [Cochlearia groenlandica]